MLLIWVNYTLKGSGIIKDEGAERVEESGEADDYKETVFQTQLGSCTYEPSSDNICTRSSVTKSHHGGGEVA